MATVFDITMENAQKMIFEASNRDLTSNDFEGRVFHKLSVETPQLDKEKTTSQIGKEIISFHNAPENISFVPGEPMEFALIMVPIKGDLELFSMIAGYLFDRRKKYTYSNNACYKEFGKHPITGNEQLANEIKNNAKGFFETIEKILNDFRVKAEKFNEEVLKPEINRIIEIERKRRDDQKKSEQQLNPFL